VTVKDLLQRERLPSLKGWAGPNSPPFENPHAAGTKPALLELAKLEPKPGREIDVLLEQKDGEGEKALLVVQGAYGLGRVTVVAFDLDKPPFTSWGGDAQRAFWTEFLKKSAPPVTAPARDNATYRPGPGQFGQVDGNDLASQLQMNLEDFEDVPVISF